MPTNSLLELRWQGRNTRKGIDNHKIDTKWTQNNFRVSAFALVERKGLFCVHLVFILWFFESRNPVHGQLGSRELNAVPRASVLLCVHLWFFRFSGAQPMPPIWAAPIMPAVMPNIMPMTMIAMYTSVSTPKIVK